MSGIVTVPHPVLRQVCRPVTQVDKKLLELIDHMSTVLITSTDPVGVGLAAPQVGVAQRLFLVRPDSKHPLQLFINPQILKFSSRRQSPEPVKKSGTKNGVYEGCLSIPHHYAPLSRSMSVTVKYQTIKDDSLVTQTRVFTGFPAHIIQHETDHLNGILFVDHVLAQNTKLFKIEGRDWQEISL